MKKEIIKVFNDGQELDLPLEEVRGGWCVPNATCITGDGKCNVNICSPNTIKQCPANK